MADIPCERNRAKQTPLTTTAAMVLFSAFQQTIGVSLDWKDTTFPSNAKYVLTISPRHAALRIAQRLARSRFILSN